MTVVCSWCRHEGRHGVVREKAPFEDRRETHGICLDHRSQVRMGWEQRGFFARLRDSVHHQDSRSIVARSMCRVWNCFQRLTQKSHC